MAALVKEHIKYTRLDARELAVIRAAADRADLRFAAFLRHAALAEAARILAGRDRADERVMMR